MREKILRIKAQDIYRFVQAALLMCILLLGAGEYLGVGEPGMIHLLIAFIVFAAALGMRRLTRRGRLFALLSFFIILFITVMTLGVRNCFLFAESYGRWLIGTDMWEPAWVAGYEMMQVIFTAVFCYILQCMLEKRFLLKMAVMCMLICILLFCLLTERHLPHAGVVFAVAYIAMAGGEWIEYFWDKEKKKDKKAYMLWIMPFMAVYVLFMLWMPAPERPFGWQFAKNAFSQVQESFITLTQNIMRGESENFDTALSGFPEDGELQGDLEDEHRAVMVIRGEDDLVSNVYLAGRIYDTFDGRQWYQENSSTVCEAFLDTIQTRYAAELYEGRYLQDCLSLTTLHIKYQYFNTGYVFIPLKTGSIRAENANLPFISKGGTLLFADAHQNADKRGYGTEYEADYYQLNSGSWDFEDFLITMQRENDQLFEDDFLESILTDNAKKTGENFSAEDINAYTGHIYDIYSEDVPLSDEVREYVEEVTRYAANDIEKLRMIEAELSSYTYTKTPGKLPEDVKDTGSFLDYFLLESREGYCTYFATAFTLLARAEGIPARYVQGFCVPMEKGGETVVYGDMGHSWPEVYIKGVGWIPFEPTPGYGSLRYTPWETERERGEAEAFASGSYGESYQGEPGQDGDSSLILAELTEAAAEENAVRGNRMTGGILKIAVYAILILAAVGVLFIITERIIRKRHYRKMDPERKFNAAVQNNLRILSWLGLRRKDTETLQEFRIRAGQELGVAKDTLTFIEKYEALLYGEKSADEAAVKETIDEGRQLLGLLKVKKKRTYFYYRARVYFY